ncbi:gustatory receptor for sugar taste 64f-like isoform X2 [Coccinella septempunctata]|uniref:gustatory receptor for sugar taste 64f-like isoform X2 n=1 Tax=Coccinella septempunctata TaxID=41139 RepID=UPI001D07A2F3|nr:gustatory receptor for sugar taste 64f-like isoform X2 [Coccinella septempunctata]
MLRNFHKKISAMKTAPQIFLPKPTVTKKSNNFHNSVKFIIVIAQYFGFFPILGLSTGSWRSVDFKWWSGINIYSLIILVGAIMQSLISLWFLLSTRNLQRFNNIVFYIRGSLTCYLFIRLARSWPGLMKEFAKVESFLRHYPLTKVNITKKLRIISICIFAVAGFEHICSQIGNFLKAFNCGKDRKGGTIEFYFTVIAHPQAFYILPYSVFIAILFQLLTIIMTFGWNFLDAFVILVSTAFSSKLIQFEEKINFLKNQRLFSSLTMVQTGLLQVYYVLSLFLLISRISFVCISGAQFYNESLNIISALTTSNSYIYNEEIERFIVEVDAAPLILSGGNFFYITKGLILELAGAIVTYELVLIQFSNQMLENPIQNASLCHV